MLDPMTHLRLANLLKNEQGFHQRNLEIMRLTNKTISKEITQLSPRTSEEEQ